MIAGIATCDYAELAYNPLYWELSEACAQDTFFLNTRVLAPKLITPMIKMAMKA
jgi:hypothetical protein